MNYPTIEQQESLVKQKLAIRKYHEDLPLVLYKYHRNVMFDNLWFKYPELMECRGHVYDKETGKLVQAAPRKCFNYLENDWWLGIAGDTKVRIEKKYNGFLACATMYKGELLVTTTGSFNSEFQQLAKKMIQEEYIDFSVSEDMSFHFEICHSSDPHIVSEKEFPYMLGYRDKISGKFIPRATEEHKILTLTEALQLVKNQDNIEGFMLSKDNSNEFCKLKTPIYVAKKKLTRITPKSLQELYLNPQKMKDKLDAKFWFLVDFIVDNKDNIKWENLTEQDRRAMLDLYLHIHGFNVI